MVRTKADRVPVKAVGAKAPSKNVGKSTPVKKSAGSNKGKSYSGGNPYHPRETPEWQKPITCFLNQNSSKETTDIQEETAGHSKSEEGGNESD
ncbi:uncharacterized protein LOC143183642 [Calliopsis andreniformis]|uniref:uncharacterized protein LOC143183642 n=1 Tax=Calliopsis andreniformis TaxID=337506 RepID=UPI003FCDADAB